MKAAIKRLLCKIGMHRGPIIKAEYAETGPGIHHEVHQCSACGKVYDVFWTDV
jgi:hypothetical protein